MGQHTVEKIGGTSMTRFGELLDNIFIGSRKSDELYNRIFVVSAYGGVTNWLLEDKKTGEPGIYGSETLQTLYEKIKNNEFLEWAEFSGNMYGTQKTYVERKLAEGKNLILEIERVLNNLEYNLKTF